MIKKKKLTKKQEAFVDLMVYQDYKQTKCAHLAGYENPGVSATRLLNYKEYSHVQERIRSLKAIQRTKNEITYEGIAVKLGEIRDIALADGSYGPAVTAEIARAKLAGLMVDRKELKIHKIDNMSRDLDDALKFCQSFFKTHCCCVICVCRYRYTRYMQSTIYLLQ